MDWPNWRGPEMNGVSRRRAGFDLVPRGGEPAVAEGRIRHAEHSVTLNGKLYFISRHMPETTSEQEKVVALDAATGEMVWEHKYNL